MNFQYIICGILCKNTVSDSGDLYAITLLYHRDQGSMALNIDMLQTIFMDVHK